MEVLKWPHSYVSHHYVVIKEINHIYTVWSGVLYYDRPCAMVVPDFELICEIMLVAEGFIEARLLARKFLTLYSLCRELLSKQDHYDWGLRAIKSVLVVAGALKRGDPDRPEDQVGSTWVNVFRIIPEFRILRLTFHRKSASKFWIKEIIIASLISFKII